MSRILFITNDINLGAGGQELANRSVIEILEKDNDLSIVNLKFFKENSNYNKIKAIKIDFLEGFIRGLFMYLCFLKAARTKNYDYILVSASPFSILLSGLLLFIMRYQKNTKVTAYSHVDPYSSLFKISRIPLVLYFASRILYKQFDLIFVTNDEMGKVFYNKFYVNKNKILTIPLTIRKNIYKMSKQKNKYNIRKKYPIVVSITRLENFQKDVYTLLDAFVIFQHRFNDAILVIVGDGPEKGSIKQYINLHHIGENVVLTGFQKNPYSVLGMATMFVLSSRSEGFGLVLVEAQYLKIPVIATDCPVGPRFILDNGKAGFLVPVGDSIKMAKAMFRVIKDSEAKNKIVKNSTQLLKRYDHNRIKAMWLQNFC